MTYQTLRPSKTMFVAGKQCGIISVNPNLIGIRNKDRY